MKTKRYRAATMREALEKIKNELGEEALVLGSEEVRSPGIFGLGAKNLIEVRVSADSIKATPNAVDTVNETPTRSRKTKFTSLSLNTSIPQANADSYVPAKPFGAAIAARAYSAEAFASAPSPAAPTGATALVLERAKTREADVRGLTDTLNSQKRKAASARAEVDSTTPAATSKRDPLLLELERMRAEMREVKFALGSLAQPRNTVAQPTFGDADARIFDSPYYEAYLHLGTLGLQPELARAATSAAIESGTDSKDIQELVRIGLINSLPSLVRFCEDPLTQPPSTSSSHQPVVALVGPTGVGKTTTVAKLAARTALREGRRVELITLDTYRIAAVEQLKIYAEIIGAGFHVPRSVLELDALIKRFSGEATILIDTIGRSARDLADQLELADYLSANDEIVKCLVLQATTQPADAETAINKFALFGVSSLVLTKLDETCRPAAAISTAVRSGLSLAYLCNGQRVPEDLLKTTPESLTACLMGSDPLAMAAAA